jgi:hypothetical protein
LLTPTTSADATSGAAWKKESGYHRRSLAETAVFRVKVIFGDRVLARSFAGGAAAAGERQKAAITPILIFLIVIIIRVVRIAHVRKL